MGQRDDETKESTIQQRELVISEEQWKIAETIVASDGLNGNRKIR